MAELPIRNSANLSRPILIALLTGISLFLTVIFLLSPEALSQKFNGSQEAMPVPGQAPGNGPDNGDAQPLNTAQENAPKAARYDFRLSGSDTLYHVLSILNVPGAEIHAVVEEARPIYDLRQLRKDTVLKVMTLGDRLDRIEYGFNDYEVLNVERAEGGFRAFRTELPHDTRETRVSGTIENSLFEDGVKAGADPQAIMILSDIFAWDVDFASDIRKGDTFGLLYDMLYVEGRPVKAGRIIGAEMVNGGKKYTAIYFDNGDGGGYYDSEGKSLRRTLLKSPLRFRRITSYFTKSRFHPILKQYRPHHGIDYAAATGTPVESAGSGRVAFAGWKRGYGNFIEIRHNNGYSTAYGHLSRITRGVRAGAKVSQGDVIGYVGSTGISTGPHLHYEVRAAGKLINPLGIKSEPDRAIAKKEMQRFAGLKEEILKKLSGETVVAQGRPSDLQHPLAGLTEVAAN